MPRADKDVERAAALEALLQHERGIGDPAPGLTPVVPTGRVIDVDGDLERLLVMDTPTLGHKLDSGIYQRCGAVVGDVVRLSRVQADRLDGLGATLDLDNLPEAEPNVGGRTDEDLAGLSAADLVAYVGQNPDERDRVRALEENRAPSQQRTTVLDACVVNAEAEAELEAKRAEGQQPPPA